MIHYVLLWHNDDNKWANAYTIIDLDFAPNQMTFSFVPVKAFLKSLVNTVHMTSRSDKVSISF